MIRETTSSKLLLIMWKNALLLRSRPLATTCGVIWPLLIGFTLIGMRYFSTIEDNKNVTFQKLDLDRLNDEYHGYLYEEPIIMKLVYMPMNKLLDEIVNITAQKLGFDGYFGVENYSKLIETLTLQNYFAGIYFNENWKNISDYPKIFNFSLIFPRELRSISERTWMKGTLFVISIERGPRNGFTADGGSPVGYYREGFIPLQHTLSMTYIDLVAKKHGDSDELFEPLPKIYMQRYPYPVFQEDYLLKKLVVYYPVIAAFAVLLPITQMVVDITAEKESGLKDVLKIMGINNWMHWLGWFISAFTVTGFGIIIMIIALKLDWMESPPVLIYSDPSALLLFFLLYIANVICFSFMMAVLVNARIAGAVFVVVSVLTFLPFELCLSIYDRISVTDKLVMSLLPNMAIGYGCTVIIEHEQDGNGLTWKNIFVPTVEGDGLTVGAIMIMMCVSSLCYFIIAMYIEQISSNAFGKGRKWYFLVSKEFWLDKKPEPDDIDFIDNRQLNPDAFEEEPIHKRVGVIMKNVSKSYDRKNALQNLSINMYYSEITVLLGHTDAGKSTIMNLLNGRIQPTKGRIFINDFNIETQLKDVQQLLGICPRRNILFKSLSVINNLRFFCRLKGLTGTALSREVDKFIRKLNLEHHVNDRVKKLSPSLKRKLCICCALCGNTRVVLYDEPSYGLDPTARRSLWDIIQSEKSSRVILISTDLIEEADVLADRIAVLCQGKLICYGSQFFLKKKFCDGYKLVCVKDEDCDSSVVLDKLREHLPSIAIISDTNTELTFYLPESKIAQYSRMLDELQHNLDELKITKFSIHISTLEEIIQKADVITEKSLSESAEIAESVNKKRKTMKSKKRKKNDSVAIKKVFSRTDDSINFNIAAERLSLDIIYDRSKYVKFNQFLAMLLKSILHTYRSKAHLISMYLLYFAMIVAAIFTASRTINEPQMLTYGIEQYKEPVVFYQKSESIMDFSFMNLVVYEYTSKSTYENIEVEYYVIPTEVSVDDLLTRLSTIDLAKIEKRFIAGATFENNSIIAWLNNEPLHTAPLTINLVHNALLRTYLNESYQIMVSLRSLPFTVEHILNHIDTNLKFGGILPVYSNMGWSILTAYFVMFSIKERISSAKMIQMVHGMNAIIFWFTRLFWDFIVLLILIAICTPLILIPDDIGFSEFSQIWKYFLFSVYFCFCVLPFMYFLSFFFQSPSVGFVVVISINIALGVLLFFFFWLFEVDGEKHTTVQILNIFDLFRIYPHFSYVTGLLNIYKLNVIYSICMISGDYYEIKKSRNNCDEIQQCCSLPNLFQYDRPGIIREIMYLLIVACSSFLTIVLMDNAIIATTCLRFRELISHNEVPVRVLDADVERLKQQIASMHLYEMGNKAVVVDRVTKFYGRFLSIKGVSFFIDVKECFGLVGVSGSGKTSIMRMMMAKENISAGYIYIQGQNIITNIDYVYRHVGYCPQKNPLIEELTGRETIRIICLISGIAIRSIVPLTNNISEALGLKKYLDKEVRTYSISNRRRLSVAIAIIGNPSVILLDEPTRSVDPVACRHIWNTLRALQEQGKAILICTKSMDECNALCNNVAVIVNGEFKCFGSIFHLKSKFSRGIILRIKVSEKQLIKNKRTNILLSTHSLTGGATIINIDYNVNRVKKFVEKRYERAVLRDEHRDVLVYYIPLEDVNWSRIFSLFEKRRLKLNIEDYILSQTSLNEILDEFSQYQREIIRKKKRRSL